MISRLDLRKMELKHFAKLTNFGLLCKIICHVVHLLKVIFLCTNEQTVISSFSGIPQSIKTRSNFLRWSLSDQIRNRNSNKRICETFSCFSRLLSNYHLPQLAIKLQQTENSPDRWLFKPKYFFTFFDHSKELIPQLVVKIYREIS